MPTSVTCSRIPVSKLGRVYRPVFDRNSFRFRCKIMTRFSHLLATILYNARAARASSTESWVFSWIVTPRCSAHSLRNAFGPFGQISLRTHVVTIPVPGTHVPRWLTCWSYRESCDEDASA